MVYILLYPRLGDTGWEIGRADPSGGSTGFEF
jgi:hypothetical protein